MSATRLFRSLCVAAAPAMGLALAVVQHPPLQTVQSVQLDLLHPALPAAG